MFKRFNKFLKKRLFHHNKRIKMIKINNLNNNLLKN